MRFNLVDSWLQLMPAQDRRLYAFASYLSAAELSTLRGYSRVDAFEDELCAGDIHHLIVWTYGPRLLAQLDLTPRSASDALIYRIPPCSGMTAIHAPRPPEPVLRRG